MLSVEMGNLMDGNMENACVFLGNDYDKFLKINLGHCMPSNLNKVHIHKEIIHLIKNEDIDTFFVREIGGYEGIYDVILKVQKGFPCIHTFSAISKMTYLSETRFKTSSRTIRKNFDNFIFSSRCELDYKKLGIMYRNWYGVENTDFIIAYNKKHGKIYDSANKLKQKTLSKLNWE